MAPSSRPSYWTASLLELRAWTQILLVALAVVSLTHLIQLASVLVPYLKSSYYISWPEQPPLRWYDLNRVMPGYVRNLELVIAPATLIVIGWWWARLWPTIRPAAESFLPAASAVNPDPEPATLRGRLDALRGRVFTAITNFWAEREVIFAAPGEPRLIPAALILWAATLLAWPVTLGLYLVPPFTHHIQTTLIAGIVTEVTRLAAIALTLAIVRRL